MSSDNPPLFSQSLQIIMPLPLRETEGIHNWFNEFSPRYIENLSTAKEQKGILAWAIMRAKCALVIEMSDCNTEILRSKLPAFTRWFLMSCRFAGNSWFFISVLRYRVPDPKIRVLYKDLNIVDIGIAELDF